MTRFLVYLLHTIVMPCVVSDYLCIFKLIVTQYRSRQCIHDCNQLVRYWHSKCLGLKNMQKLQKQILETRAETINTFITFISHH